MRIYLMRHATAADPGGSSDALRPLTEQGRREAREAGRALRDEGAEIAVVLSSPRLRARETAELVVEGLGRPVPVEVRETLNCGATGKVYLAEIRAQEAGSLLLVGHNPEMSAIASTLVGQSLSFRPATLCAIDLEEDSASLRWLRHPGPSD
jgi:phosphohistidine phosphatase